MISLIILKDFMCKSMDFCLTFCLFVNLEMCISQGVLANGCIHLSLGHGSAGDLGEGTLNTESSFFHLLGLFSPLKLAMLFIIVPSRWEPEAAEYQKRVSTEFLI